MRDLGRGLKVGRANTNRTSPLLVPLIFWVAGTVAIMAGLWRLFVVRRLFLNGDVGAGRVIAAVHLFTLGGFTMVMMGALYQLVPVLLNTEPVRPRLATIQWAVYASGVVTFVVGMNDASTGAIGVGGIGLLLGIGFFVANVGGRFRLRKTFNITGWFFGSAIGYLAITLVLGGLLSVRYTSGAPSFGHELAIHLTVALGGWFGLLVMGTSYRLWAMFGRKHREPKQWRLTWLLVNLAVVALVAGDLTSWWWATLAGWLSQFAAFVTYVADIAAAGLFDSRTMRDAALRTVWPGTVFLAMWEVLGSMALFGHQPRLWIPALLCYGLGWVGMSFLGFVQKIVPFIIWLHRYAHVHGQGKMPRLDDIWRPDWAYPPMISATLGMVCLVVGLGIKNVAVFTTGIVFEILAWLVLAAAGVRAVGGPHQRPE